jgi:hypothetical protein
MTMQYKVEKLRKAAEGKECMVRLDGCGHDHGVVLAHFRMAGTCGTGFKPHDFQGAWACFECHQKIDGDERNEHQLDFLKGVLRTQEELIRAGVVTFFGQDEKPRKTKMGCKKRKNGA